MPVAALASDVVAHVRAGINVASFSQAVQELVDNSLDAGATLVEVRVDLGSAFSIEVADNGVGMTLADLRVVGSQRYCTSKLPRGIRDLERGVSTYGFRGEAMASLAEVPLPLYLSLSLFLLMFALN